MSAAEVLNIKPERDALEQTLTIQRSAFQRQPYLSREQRINLLDRLQNALIENREALLSAVNADFGTRSDAETLMAEIFPLLDGIAYCRKHLKRWMKPRKRRVPPVLAPASVRVQAQPLGVVGIVVPWNFPIFLGLSPMVYAIAAGNRVMIKMSEYAPATGALLEAILGRTYSQEEVAVINGDVDVATSFTSLPFDHLVFTGSTDIGRIVMRAAAENLTPVTLELGGKSPALIHPDFPAREAAKRLAFGKTLNAGQICVAPDYVLCHRKQVNNFCREFIAAVKDAFPSIEDNPDYTAIINARQRERLASYVSDAVEKGARTLEVNPREEKLDDSKKLPVTLLLDVNDDMAVMQAEIFGPILPVMVYDDISQALSYINERPRPLALYYFDWNQHRANDVLKNTHSGGACINDTLSHVMADDIPFGGVGPSGMGHYHGQEGFETFSNMRGVVMKGRINSTALVGPPWDRFFFRSLVSLQWLRFRKRAV